MRVLLLAMLLLADLIPVATAAAPTVHGYRVEERRPLPPGLFIQGLEIRDGSLYVSTGRYGRSRLLRFALDGIAPEQGLRLPADLWGEGLTLFGDEIFQLTWKARRLLVFHRETLDFRREIALPGEGWGITGDGERLIYSDGSNLLHYLRPGDGRLLGSVPVTLDGRPLPCLNELEWVQGRVWANVWLTDYLVMINPRSGVVDGIVDLSGLLPARERRRDTDVLNGIARDPADGAIWVTGKHWPWLYRVALEPPAPEPLSPEDRPIQYNQASEPTKCIPYSNPIERTDD